MKSIPGIIAIFMIAQPVIVQAAEDGAGHSEATAQTNQLLQIKQQMSVAAERTAGKAREVAQTLEIKSEQIMADLAEPVEKIKAKVANLDRGQLSAYVEKYKELLAQKKEEIAATTQKLQDVPWTKKLGAEARELKQQLKGYKQELTSLTEKYAVYLKQLTSNEEAEAAGQE